MDDRIREKLLDHLTTDKAIEYYTALAGRKATKTDCRQLAGKVIPYMLDQLDVKASKDTKTADKLHEYLGQSFEKEAAEDPKFGSAVLSTLLGSKKAEIIGMNADDMLVHPFVVENMMIAMAPMVMRAYGNEFGRDVFMPGLFGLGGGRRPAPAPKPAPEPKPVPKPVPKPAPAPKSAAPTMRRPEEGMGQRQPGRPESAASMRRQGPESGRQGMAGRGDGPQDGLLGGLLGRR